MNLIEIEGNNFRVAGRTDLSGRISAGSINDGSRAKSQGSLWHIWGSTIFGCVVSVGILAFLAPVPAQAEKGGVPAEIAALQAQVAVLQSQVQTLQTSNSALQSQINALQTQLNAVQSNPALALGPFVSVDPNPENGVIGPNIKISGANIHILSGSGATNDNGNRTGLGNLIIGYDETFTGQIVKRGGSHNLVIGSSHNFTSSAFGGLVAGNGNTISAESVTVLSGNANTASGSFSTVLGGNGNSATGEFSVVCGGIGNTASNSDSTVLGGNANTPDGLFSVVIGGLRNTVTDFGDTSVVLGEKDITNNPAVSIRLQPPFSR